MQPTPDTQLSTWRAALTEAGIADLPAPLQRALDVRHQLRERFAAARDRPRRVAETAVNAMLDGHDTDEALNTAAAQLWAAHADQELQGAEVLGVLHSRIRALMVDHQADLYAQAAPQVTEAARRLEKAAVRLPEDLAPGSVLAADAGPAWTEATTAARRLLTLAGLAEPIRTTWREQHWLFLVEVPDAEVLPSGTPAEDPRHKPRRAHFKAGDLLKAQGRRMEGLIRIARGEVPGVRINVTADPGELAARTERNQRAHRQTGGSLSMVA
ncbi:hypothetical protein J0910_02065 [Nocardiopsis sp. CNT-189]|uniref:hypothetical protein n=1 Tax=Nocardiopsis oceanisediminis TaxID=2816862 RepID=UPI003B2F07BE